MSLLLAWCGLILLVLLVPMPGMDLHWLGAMDSLVHLSLFLILGGLARQVLREQPDYAGIVYALLGGLFVIPEFLQSIVPTRGVSLLDLYFNGSGIVVGLLLASVFTSLVYISLGMVGLGVSFGSSVLSRPLFTVVFAGVPDGVMLLVPVLCLLGFVVLMSLLSRSPGHRFLVLAGGLSYLLLFRLAEADLPRTITGLFLLALMAGLYLEDRGSLPDVIAQTWNMLSIVLYVASGTAIFFSQEAFLLNAGSVLGVGGLLGMLLSLGYGRLIHQRTNSSTASGQS